MKLLDYRMMVQILLLNINYLDFKYMPCIHKFYNDINHLQGENGLIPNWEINTLFIGTFNPSKEWNK